jgi:hypothetical protein
MSGENQFQLTRFFEDVVVEGSSEILEDELVRGDLTVQGDTQLSNLVVSGTASIAAMSATNVTFDRTGLSRISHVDVQGAISDVHNNSASSTHNHSGVYSLVSHTHSASSFTITPHGGMTAPTLQGALNYLEDYKSQTNHNHNATYSSILHVHSGIYAALAHTHDSTGITFDPTAVSPTFPGGITNVELALEYLNVNKSGTAHVHDATTVTYTAPSPYTGDNVRTSLDEIYGEIDGILPITASSVSFDPAVSGLVATDIKAAIDELAANGSRFIYVDAQRSGAYTPNGTAELPYKTISAALVGSPVPSFPGGVPDPVTIALYPGYYEELGVLTFPAGVSLKGIGPIGAASVTCQDCTFATSNYVTAIENIYFQSSNAKGLNVKLNTFSRVYLYNLYGDFQIHARDGYLALNVYIERKEFDTIIFDSTSADLCTMANCVGYADGTSSAVSVGLGPLRMTDCSVLNGSTDATNATIRVQPGATVVRLMVDNCMILNSVPGGYGLYILDAASTDAYPHILANTRMPFAGMQVYIENTATVWVEGFFPETAITSGIIIYRPASSISFNGTDSTMAATTVQAAIDELNERIEDVEGSDVDSFNGRQGIVVPAIGDYSAALINYDNSSTLMTATNAQDAIDESYFDLLAQIGQLTLEDVTDGMMTADTTTGNVVVDDATLLLNDATLTFSGESHLILPVKTYSSSMNDDVGGTIGEIVACSTDFYVYVCAVTGSPGAAIWVPLQYNIGG